MSQTQNERVNLRAYLC